MPIPDNLVSSEFGLSGIQITTELHAGPLPSPDTIERYERLQPGTLDRLLTMAENDQHAKIDRGSRVIDYHNRMLTAQESREWLSAIFAQCGQVFGFITVLIFFAILAYSMYLGSEWMFGVILGAGALAGIVQLVRSFQNRGNGSR